MLLSQHVISVVCGRVIFCSVNFDPFDPFFFQKLKLLRCLKLLSLLYRRKMRVNEQIATLKQNFEDLQKSLRRTDVPTASNGTLAFESSDC